MDYGNRGEEEERGRWKGKRERGREGGRWEGRSKGGGRREGEGGHFWVKGESRGECVCLSKAAGAPAPFLPSPFSIDIFQRPSEGPWQRFNMLMCFYKLCKGKYFCIHFFKKFSLLQLYLLRHHKTSVCPWWLLVGLGESGDNTERS